MDPLLVQEVFMGNVMSAGLGQVRHLFCKRPNFFGSLYLCFRALQQHHISMGHMATA